MSIDDLESAVGSAQSSEYDEDDTTGQPDIITIQILQYLLQ